MDAIGNWGRQWRFSFGIGPDKAAVLVVGSRSRDPHFSLQGHSVPCVPERKWSKHCDRLVEKMHWSVFISFSAKLVSVMQWPDVALQVWAKRLLIAFATLDSPHGAWRIARACIELAPPRFASAAVWAYERLSRFWSHDIAEDGKKMCVLTRQS